MSQKNICLGGLLIIIPTHRQLLLEKKEEPQDQSTVE